MCFGEVVVVVMLVVSDDVSLIYDIRELESELVKFFVERDKVVFLVGFLLK